jgi:hypothetical protein
VCDGDAGEVVMQAAVAASFVVIEAQTLLELAVVVLDAPAQLGQLHERGDGGLGGQVAKALFIIKFVV